MIKAQKKSEKLEDQLKNIISKLLDVTRIKEEGINIKIDNINIGQFIVHTEGDEKIISPVYIDDIKPNTKLFVDIDSTIDKKSNRIYAKLSVDKHGNVNSEYIEDDDLDISPEDPKEDKKSLKEKVIDKLKKWKDTIINLICTIINIICTVS